VGDGYLEPALGGPDLAVRMSALYTAAVHHNRRWRDTKLDAEQRPNNRGANEEHSARLALLVSIQPRQLVDVE
jgi:hypothetical protein